MHDVKIFQSPEFGQVRTTVIDTLFVLLFMAFAVSADAIAEAVAVAVEEVLK